MDTTERDTPTTQEIESEQEMPLDTEECTSDDNLNPKDPDIRSSIQGKINLSSEDIKRYSKTVAPASKVTLLAPIDFIVSFLKVLNEGIDITILFKSSVFICVGEALLSLILNKVQIGLYYCIGTCLLCVFIYLTNSTPHYKKTVESVKLYFNAGTLLDAFNRITTTIQIIKNKVTHKDTINSENKEDISD